MQVITLDVLCLLCILLFATFAISDRLEYIQLFKLLIFLDGHISFSFILYYKL